MKTKTLLLVLVVAIAGTMNFSSCDKVKTNKFDGTYSCSTSFTSGTSSAGETPTSLSTNRFTATIDLQEISVTIDGRTSTAEVSNDGDFYLTFEWSIPLIGDAVYELDGKVDSDGDMSGTIIETVSVLGGLGVDVANGTFEGAKD